MSKIANIEQDDRWFRGEDKQLTFLVVDAAGDPVDMTDWTLKWQIEELHDGATDVLAKVSGSGIAVSNSVGTNDLATVTIESSDTAAIEARVYRQSLWRTDSSTPQLLAVGTAMLQQGPEYDADFGS